MLFNHDFYKPHTDLTYFDKYANYPDIRDDTPIMFLPINGGKRLALVSASSGGPGIASGITFPSGGTINKTYSDGNTYKMIYHYKDGGISWDGYDASIFTITPSIDISNYDTITIRGVAYTSNSSLDYSLLMSLTSEPPPARVYGQNYDFTGWKEFLTGDHAVASTSIQVNYDITIPISEITSETGLLYFNYAIRHNQNIHAYSICTGIRDLIFSSILIY